MQDRRRRPRERRPAKRSSLRECGDDQRHPTSSSSQICASWFAPKFFGKLQSHPNVSRLGALVTASKEHDDGLPLSTKVDPVPGPKVNPQFGNAAANGSRLTGIPGGQALHRNQDLRASDEVSKAVDPSGELPGLAYLEGH